MSWNNDDDGGMSNQILEQNMSSQYLNSYNFNMCYFLPRVPFKFKHLCVQVFHQL